MRLLLGYSQTYSYFTRLPLLISCPVASVLYREGKEEGRRKKEAKKKEEGRKKNLTNGSSSHNFYTNDTNGHDMTSNFCKSPIGRLPYRT